MILIYHSLNKLLYKPIMTLQINLQRLVNVPLIHFKYALPLNNASIIDQNIKPRILPHQVANEIPEPDDIAKV